MILIISSFGHILREITLQELEGHVGPLSLHQSYTESGIGFYHTDSNHWDTFFIDMSNYNLDSFFSKNDYALNNIIPVLRNIKLEILEHDNRNEN